MADDYVTIKAKGTPYDSLIQQKSQEYGVNYDLLHKQIYSESSFNPNAKSPTGPRGLAQMTKATGKAYGLVTDADFNDPNKSVDAMARHMRDLLGKYQGDEVLALLAYNQGEGPVGRKQIEAFQQGKYDQVSSEGLNYVSKLQDVISNDSAGKHELLGKKTLGKPESDPLKGLKGIGEGLPDTAGFLSSSKGNDLNSAPTPQFGQNELLQTGGKRPEDLGIFEGTGKAAETGFLTSTLGTMARANVHMESTDDSIMDVLRLNINNPYTFDEEDLNTIRAAKLQPDQISAINGATSKSSLMTLINLAKEARQMEESTNKTSGTGAKIIGGILGAGYDPLTYIPLVGQGAKALTGSRIITKAAGQGLQVAGISVASEFVRERTTGIEASYADAAVGGAIFGAGLSGLMDVGARVLRKEGLKPEADTVTPSALRLEDRESAINTNTPDPTMRRDVAQDANLPTEVSPEGIEFKQHPTEEGSVVMSDGSVISADNPINPNNEIPDLGSTEKAAKGLRMGSLTEIGLSVLGSIYEDVRKFGSLLVRSPTGMESGSHGVAQAVAADIAERINSLDRATYSSLVDALDESAGSPKWYHFTNKQALYEQAFKRVADAIENPHKPIYQKALQPEDMKLHDLLKEHFDRKLDMLMNPQQFGNINAKPLLKGTRHGGTYLPVVYDDAAKKVHLLRFGGADGLQEAIKKSWLASYHSISEVKTRVDAYLKNVLKEKGIKETPEAMQAELNDYIHRKSYGISHSDEFAYSSAVSEVSEDSLKGLENNNFLEARNLFDNDHEILTSDGGTFSVNDLRSYDMGSLIPAYDRRVNGDIAIMGSTGKTTKELKDAINVIQAKAKASGEGKYINDVAALTDTVKLLTGRARGNPDRLFGSILKTMMNLTFISKNAYMGALNITEIAGLVAKGHVHMILKGVPYINEFMQRVKGSSTSMEVLKEAHGILFGKEIDDSIRPSALHVRQSLRKASGSSSAIVNTVANMKWITGELSARTPWSKALGSTTNYLIDAARQGYLSDIIDASFGKANRRIKENVLKSASITPSQYEGVLSLIQDCFQRDEKGLVKLVDKEKFRKDPRSMDLWRLADKLGADEAILRPSHVWNQSTRQSHPLLQAVTQFKMFALRSVNGKAVRAYHEATKNNRTVDMLIATSIGVGLAGLGHIATTYMKAQSLPESERKAYLDKMLNPKMLAYAAISRSSILGAPLGLANIVGGPFGFDTGQDVRSSIIAKTPTGKNGEGQPLIYGPRGGGGFADRFLDAIPSVGFAASTGQALYNGAHLALGDNHYWEDQGFRTGLYNGLKNIVPNDPITQRLLIEMMTEHGIKIDQSKQ